jgi:hypothetical protein
VGIADWLPLNKAFFPRRLLYKQILSASFSFSLPPLAFTKVAGVVQTWIHAKPGYPAVENALDAALFCHPLEKH